MAKQNDTRQKNSSGFMALVADRSFYVLGVILFMIVWQIAASLRLFGADFSEAFSPLAAIRALIEMIKNGELIHHALPSLRRVLLGLSLAVVVALPIGVLVGYFKRVEQLTYVVFQFMRMISPLAWMPIAIIIFGVGDVSVVFLLWLVAIWPLILNTSHGAGRVSPLWVNMAKTMGAMDMGILRKVVIPAAVPDMLTGLRLAVGVSWIILVPAEMLGVPDGLGYFILDTRDRFRYDQLMATIMAIGMIGYLLDSANRWLIHKFSWKN
ncbi:MAG: ABC transporter permease [Chlorobiaceae bacterium]|nr:ABC transporter permease [Chlorobiaceae bacterium]